MSIILKTVQGFFGIIISVLVAGCASQPPHYDLYPTLSLSEREKNGNNDWWSQLNSKINCKEINDWWGRRYCEELKVLNDNEWKPDSKLLENTFKQVEEEYDVQPINLSVLKEVFDEEINPNNIQQSAQGMLVFIDHEHPNLLVSHSVAKSIPSVDSYPLLSMVSKDYPVGVSITRWKAQESPDKETSTPNFIIIPNTVIVSANKSQITTPDGKVIGEKKEAVEKEDAPKNAEKKSSKATAAKTLTIEDFAPEQTVPLSLSVVLNSPSTLDRIEYISTYILLEPFPFPPNADVVLEKEFWRQFFSLHSQRDKQVEAKAGPLDVRRAIDDMRVRIIDTDTTVQTLVDLGSLKRTTKDAFGAELAATITTGISLPSLNPKLTYSNEVDAEENQKLQQQIDQRSSYVDPPGSFLRITQRGMQSVNLAGRFVEQVKLHIPAAHAEIPVLVPIDDKATAYAIKWLSEPLYSRVDALTYSVVVARQATKLASRIKEFFRSEDLNDAAFIVGVTRPYRFTMWQNERSMSEVKAREIFGMDEHITGNKTVYFTASKNETPKPLKLYKLSPEQQHALLAKIQKTALDRQKEKDKYKVISFSLADSKEKYHQQNVINIGLADNPEQPTKLVDFDVEHELKAN